MLDNESSMDINDIVSKQNPWKSISCLVTINVKLSNLYF